MLLEPARQAAMRGRMAELRRPNGADVAADRITRWCTGPLPMPAAEVGATATESDERRSRS